ncbi:MAG: peptide ABC transporter substrate-binding protein [Dehalococcoidia bacterium]|nr:MAG: peptide ABC transporter substrate-binding protein [Dehalococcoidia bacterium]
MKKIVSLLLALVFVIALVGCNPGGTALPAAGGSGTLNLYNIDPLTLDPALAGDATSNGYVLQLFSGLVRLDNHLEPVADIASGWQISPDGLTYTFKLRRDVTFRDGRKVMAADIKYSWERACNPATSSQTASTYLGDIQGAAEMLSGKAQSLSGVQLVDDYTLKVTLVSASSAFLAKLSYPTAFVVDKNDIARGSSWWQSPNGSGPFRLDSWARGSRLVLERNPLYYGDKAKLNKVVSKLLAGIPMNLYESGDIDVADMDVSYYDRVMDPAGPFYSQLVTTPELSLTYLGFDVSKPPFDDSNIRRAFSMAVNKQRLAQLMFRDVLAPAGGILPPGMPGYNAALQSIAYDVNAARALIAASRYGSTASLPKIVITTSGYGGAVPGDLVAIVYDWQTAFGIDIEIRQLDPSQFSYFLKQEKDSMFYWGWGADYAHPQNFLEVLFGTDTTYNIGGYSNAQFDALLKEAAATTDEAASFALYRQAEQLLVNDAACIPLWTGKNLQLVQSYVKGYALNALGQVALNHVYIQK